MNLLCTFLKLTCVAGTITGHAYAYDGDTIYVANQAVRLAGIDAEELSEPHGYEARDHLRSLLGNSVVTCRWDGWSYDRKVAICFTVDWNVNLNASMVRDGYALDCAHYSRQMANGHPFGLYRSLEPAGARQRLIQKGYC